MLCMAESESSIRLTSMASASERMFPTLTLEQIERAAAHGRIRHAEEGEVLLEAGSKNTRFFIVKTGQLEIVRPPGTDGNVVASVGPGQFTGETYLLSGRRG